VGFETYTADGSISYWNSYVGVSQMGGHGSFSDPRIGLAIAQKPDRVTPKLPALLGYQLSLQAPAPPSGSFDAAAARRGERCLPGRRNAPAVTSPRPIPTLRVVRIPRSRCSTPPLKPGWNQCTRHAARRSPGIGPRRCAASGSTRRTSMTAARAICCPVVNHYDRVLALHLSSSQKADLVEFLKSL
jgi:hypothetical protein